METRPFENEVHEYRPGLRLRSLRFVSDGETFERLYCGVPILSAGLSLSSLVGRAFAARRDQLPAGEARDALVQRLEQELERRWQESQRDGDG